MQMLKVIIIEDEAPSVKKIVGFLKRLTEPTEVLFEINSVKSCLEILSGHHHADLIFSDIELLDGNVFEALNKLTVDIPIIFITAYDDYWMNAFETNGIEYLLKPFSFNRFKKSLDKYQRLKLQSTKKQEELLKQIGSFYAARNTTEQNFSTYLPVTAKQETYFLKIDQIMYFQVNYGVIKAFDQSGKMHLLNQSRLAELEPKLNPADFFRINRSEIVNRTAIDKISRFGKNTVAIALSSQQNLKTSQTRTAAFNKWMGL